MKSTNFRPIFFSTFFEGEPPVTPPVDQTPITDANKPVTRSYTEEEFQKAIDAEKRRADESARKAIQELETLKKGTMTSEAQKAELQKKIDDLSVQFMTKEQLAKQEKEKLVSTYEDTVKTVSTERDKWKDRYVQTTVQRELTDAAIKFDAYSPEPFLAILGPKTQVVESVAEDGTVNYKVEVRLPTEKDGKPATLVLDPMQAVKQLKDRPEDYGYLFKGHNNAGVGGKSSEKLNEADYKSMTIEEYSRHRPNILKG